MLALPLVIIRRFGQAPGDAQMVEDFAVIGAPAKLRVLQRPQFLKGAVVIDEVLARAEDRDGGVDLVEGALVGLDMLAQVDLGFIKLGDVDGEPAERCVA